MQEKFDERARVDDDTQEGLKMRTEFGNVPMNALNHSAHYMTKLRYWHLVIKFPIVLV